MAFITPASKLFILSCILNFSLGMDITNQDFNAVVGTLSHVIITENQKKKKIQIWVCFEIPKDQLYRNTCFSR